MLARYWATGLDGGNGESNFEHNDTMSVCTISATLTEEGMDHVEEVSSGVDHLMVCSRDANEKAISIFFLPGMALDCFLSFLF